MKHTPLDFRAHEIEMVVRNWPEWNLMGHECVHGHKKSET